MGPSEIALREIVLPIAVDEFQVLNNPSDSKPLIWGEFLSWNLNNHPSLRGDSLHDKGRIPSRSPTKSHLGLIHTTSHKTLGELPCPEGTAFINLVRILT